LARWIVVGALAVTAIAAGCTMKSQDAPPLTGPSELGTSITVSVSPDILVQDGSSQSLVTILARDSNGKALRNLSLRNEILVDGVRSDFGSLSARNVVTDNNGRATFVYTSPAGLAGPAVDTPITTVSIAVTPIGSDFGNSSARLATIRLVPSTVVVPADGLSPYFRLGLAVSGSGTITDHQVVLFDACYDPPPVRPCAPTNNPVASYSWDFGDGAAETGKSATHSYDDSGTFVVELKITDFAGRTATTSQTINVGPGVQPTASFTFSPTDPTPGQQVNFNASGSKAAAGHSIVSYSWEFGDGKPGAVGVQASRVYPAGTYTVTLVVTDETGKTDVVSKTVPVKVPTAPLPIK
jgi:chitodextrinase